MENLDGQIEELTPMIVEHGLSVLGAVFILLIGWWLAGWAKKKVMKRGKAADGVDNTLVPILGQTTKILILVVTILAVLGQFGVETTSIVAVLGASALAVGLALQGTLSNVASGVMLLILRPFKVGDAVEIGGTSGVVDEIGLFTTELHTFDNIGVSMPNSNVWGSEIKNMNRFEKRRVDMVFGIDYSDDMDKAIDVIKKVLSEDDRILSDPAPQIAVSNLGDSSVDIITRPWVDTPNVWPVRFDITKKVKEQFDANDISFPFPQRDVHLFKEN